jgi:hypothetical protein
LSAGVSAFAGHVLPELGLQRNVVVRAAIGGLASVAGGGKFGNGAVTAAFGYLFNELSHESEYGGPPQGQGSAGIRTAYCLPCALGLTEAASATANALGALAIGIYDLLSEESYPSILYHYTSEDGMEGIVASGMINPSLKAVNPNDARYGDEQYFSDIIPGTKTSSQLSRTFIGNPFQGNRFSHYVGVNVQGLTVLPGRPHVYVVPNQTPLNVRHRITVFGPNQ